MDDRAKMNWLIEYAEQFLSENSFSLAFSELAKKNFPLDGKAFIALDLSAYYYKTGEKSGTAESIPWAEKDNHFITKNSDVEKELENLMSSYEPKKEYVIFLYIRRKEPEVGSVHLLMKCPLFDSHKKPSRISKKQIRKRLKRMQQAGQTLIILNTSNPDFMGRNLEKWMKEIKWFNNWGDGAFSVMIDSSPEFPAILPDDLKADVVTIPVQ